MHTPSILAQAFCEQVLTTARKNLAHDGFLAPVLFVNVAASAPLIVPLKHPPTPAEKQPYFTAIGAYFRMKGHTIVEAVLLSESWAVSVQKAPAALHFPPSQHPSRQEAITLIGRNADNNLITSVMQVFTRGKDKHLVWGEVLMAVYNEPVETAGRPSGLLDYLFLANQAR